MYVCIYIYIRTGTRAVIGPVDDVSTYAAMAMMMYVCTFSTFFLSLMCLFQWGDRDMAVSPDGGRP